MNKKIKYMSILVIISLICLINVYSVQVITDSSQINNNNMNKENQGFVDKYKDSIVGGVVLGLIVAGLLGLFYFLLFKVFKKIKEERRKGNDLLFYKFKNEEKLNRLHADKRFKKRNWKTLFLTYNRSPVYIKDSNNNLTLIGYYDGEFKKKEGILQLLIYNQVTFFNRFTRLILIPINLSYIFQKETYANKNVIVLYCDGIDEVGNTDYYYIPLIKYKDKNNKQSFLDFSDYIQKEYFNKYIYRQVIKDTILESREAVKHAIEMNPTIHYKRKDNN